MKRFPLASIWIGLVVFLGMIFLSWWYAMTWFESAFPTLSRSLEAFWTHPYLSLGSFGLTLAFMVKATGFLALLWIFTRVASMVLRTQILDKTALGEGRKFSLQRLTSYTLFGIGALAGLNALGMDLSSLAV